MQSGFLLITIGFQFFLLAGYMFYFVFRKWSAVDDQVMLLSWVAGLLGVLTLGLLVSVALVLPRMVFEEAIFTSAIVILDILGFFLIVKETWNRKMTIEHGLLVEET